MSLFINGKSSLKLHTLLKPVNGVSSGYFPFNESKAHYFYSARYALAGGIASLGLKADDIVLLPSYSCGVEIEPFLSAQVQTCFYAVKRDLSIDIDDLSAKITPEIKAVLVTHYLGFPQPIETIARLCREHKIPLIEDCAHGLFSKCGEELLGTFGDLAVFSLLKTLPVPNGGLLLLNNPELVCTTTKKTPSLFSTWYYVSELLSSRTDPDDSMRESGKKAIFKSGYMLMNIFKLLLAAANKTINGKALFNARPDSSSYEPRISQWGISKLSHRVINNIDPHQLITIRRRNFQYLLERLALKRSENILYSSLPSGVCPLFFPLLVESCEQRDFIYASMKKMGVTTHPWWKTFHAAVNWDEFPDAVYLKECLLGLPIHQDISRRHLDRIVEVVETVFDSLESNQCQI